MHGQAWCSLSWTTFFLFQCGCGPEARAPKCAPNAGRKLAYPNVLRMRAGGPRTQMCSECGPEARVPKCAPNAGRKLACPNAH